MIESSLIQPTESLQNSSFLSVESHSINNSTTAIRLRKRRKSDVKFVEVDVAHQYIPGLYDKRRTVNRLR